MTGRWRYAVGIAVTAALFVLIHLGGLHIVAPLVGTEPAPGARPGDARLGLVFVLALLVVTGLMLAAFRWGLSWLVRGAVLLVAFGLSTVVLDVLLPAGPVFEGVPILPVAIAAGLIGVLAVHPEWYVLNVTGVLVGAGAVGLLGITLDVRAAIGLLVLLAIYDLVSVYGTKHMLTLAEGAMRGRLPVVLVVPMTLPFSLLGEEEGDSFAPEGAIVIGLGDAVIPGLLATSAALYGPGDPAVVAEIALSAPVVGVMAGTVLGLVTLFVLPAEGEAHPGLPFLATGAILGYLVGAAIVGVGPIDAVGGLGAVG